MWLCAGATFFDRSFEFLFGGFEVFIVRLGLDRWSEVLHHSFELSIGFLGVSCCSRGLQSVVRCFSCSFAFLASESGACWRSGGFVVESRVSVKVSAV